MLDDSVIDDLFGMFCGIRDMLRLYLEGDIGEDLLRELLAELDSLTDMSQAEQ